MAALQLETGFTEEYGRSTIVWCSPQPDGCGKMNLDSKAKLDIFWALQYGASVSAIEDGKEVGYARPVKGHKNTWVVYLY